MRRAPFFSQVIKWEGPAMDKYMHLIIKILIVGMLLIFAIAGFNTIM